MPIRNDRKTGLVIHAACAVAPEDASRFAHLVRRHVAQTQRRPGCNGLAFAADMGAPATFHIVEAWTDRAALDAHNASPDFHAAMVELLSRVRIRSRETQLYTVSTHDRAAPFGLHGVGSAR